MAYSKETDKEESKGKYSRHKRGKKKNFNTKKSTERDDSINSRPTGGKASIFEKDVENDIKWWSKYPETMKQAANIPYAWPTGVPIVTQTAKAVGCAMVFPTTIGVGITKETNSPANIQMRHLVAKIVQTLGGSGNGDPSDYAEYLLSLDSIYAFIAWCTRVYGLGTAYFPENRFLPNALLNTEGVDANDVRANYAKLRTWINLWISQIETYAAPAEYAIYDRHIQLFSNIYSDFADPRGQIYMYSPYVFYKLDESQGKLLARTIVTSGDISTLTKVDDIVSFGNDLIKQMTSSQIYQDLSARIRRAYGDKLYHINPMPETHTIVPVYSPEVLLEIHNTVLVGEPTLLAELDITQRTAHGDSDLVFDPSFTNATMFSNLTYKNFVDVPIPGNISPEMTMIASRGLVTFEKTETANTYKIKSCGTELVHSAIMAWFNGAGALEFRKIGCKFNNQGAQFHPFTVGLASTFDWAPFFSYTSSGPLVGDTTKVAIIDDDTVDLLNRVALESALDVPRVTNTR